MRTIPPGALFGFPRSWNASADGLARGLDKIRADGEEIRAASRYKALGNAIALPCAEYIMAGIKEVLHDPV